MLKEFEKRLLSSIILIPSTFLIILEGEIFFYIFLSLAFLISSYEWLKMIKRYDLKILGILFLLFSFYSAFYFRSQNLEGFLLIILICISTDIGGYLFGKLFKGPKLTKLSPNKTYAGMFGGYFLSLISVTTIPYFKYDVMLLNDFLIVIAISSVSQIGDITISYFKRLSKIKDTGKIIPGHGGLLDRVDGMIFAFPFTFIIVYIGLF